MIIQKVESFLKKNEFDIQNNRILVGVSGGPDSLALLHFLWSLRETWNIQISVGHVDHMFRGEESLNEAKFVESFCEERGIRFYFKQINVPEYIKNTGKSAQVAARDCRYQFFEELMVEHKLPLLALGHHGDDQVETILMRLTRGSTGRARAGIPFTRSFSIGKVFRPFLCLSREEIERYCKLFKLDPRIDPSNEKDSYSRNRFRHHVIPFLKSENALVHEHFQRFSGYLLEDEQFLYELTVKEMNTVLKKKKPGEITIDIEAFLDLPITLQRRGIQLILNYLYQEIPASLTTIHTENIIKMLCSANPSGRMDLPNQLKVVRSYSNCHFHFSSYYNCIEPYTYIVSEPGEILLPNGSILKLEYTQEVESNTNPFSLLLERNDLTIPIIIRTRKSGDRMTLKGMEGTKKIKDIFIDKKVPIEERKGWPIITNKYDQILWVPGLKKYNYTLNENSNIGYILLTYIKH